MEIGIGFAKNPDSDTHNHKGQERSNRHELPENTDRENPRDDEAQNASDDRCYIWRLIFWVNLCKDLILGRYQRLLFHTRVVRGIYP